MRRGTWGERAAAVYLTRLGYTILARGYCSRWGEIDVIASDGTYLAFVEVKTRSSTRMGAPCEAVTPAKQRRIICTAQCWLAAHPTTLQPRLDVIEVYGPEGGPTERIHHIKNAFEA